ncbi:MAG: hypothetical protein B7Y88_00370 [Sphingomonadales bacterium 32-64-17]|nr:MAG: hypothetical protein B7Y88_00370 [Sphingomonadales bacterium 32-64-17]
MPLRLAIPAISTGFRARMVMQYACADFGKSLLWRTFNVLALVYLVKDLGLDPKVAGALLLISLIFDAITDPIAGAMIDQWLRRGYSLRLIYRVAPVCSGILLCLLFSLHLWPGPQVPVAIVLACLLLFRLAYTFADVPANMASANCELIGRGQTTLWATKRAFAQGASLLVAFGVAPLLNENRSNGDPALYLEVMVPLALLTVLAYLLSARALPHAEARTKPATKRTCGPQDMGLIPALRKPPANRQLVRLVVIVLAVCALGDMLAAGLLFLPWQEGSGQFEGRAPAALAVIAMAIGSCLSIPLGLASGLALGQKRSLQLACLTTACAAIAFTLIPSELLTARLAALALYGCGLAMSSLTYWSMAKAVLVQKSGDAKQDDVKASSIALLSVAVKVGSGLSSALVGWILTVTSQVHPESAIGPVPLTLETALVIGVVVGTSLSLIASRQL